MNLFFLKFGTIKLGDLPDLKIDISKYGQNNIPFTSNDPTTSAFASVFNSQFENFNNTIVFDLNSQTVEPLCQWAINETSKSIDKYLSCIGRNKLENLIDEYFIAMDFSRKADKITLTAHFNNQPFHIPPLALNAITNNLFKYFTNSTKNSIYLVNHPLPRTLDDTAREFLSADQTSYQLSTGLAFGFGFLIASFSAFLIKERVSDAKHLQFMNGCNIYIYWLATFIWDMVNYLITAILTIILFAVYQNLSYCIKKI